MSDWRKHEDARASANPLTKIVINGVERTTLARELSHEDVVFGAGFGVEMKAGKKFGVAVVTKHVDTGADVSVLLKPGQRVTVESGMVFVVEEEHGMQSNGAARR